MKGWYIMHLEKIILKNFRGYSTVIEIKIDDLTAFIGKNDAGKSSVLDALNTFFNESKLDVSDRCVYSSETENTTIGCVFSGFPSEIILDETVITSLESEYLLNQDGYLEILKEYSPTGKQSVFINAYHPCNDDMNDLLGKKNLELKRLITQKNLQDETNLSVNSVMRKALWANAGDQLNLSLKAICADKEDAKNIWEKIKGFLPKYALFKADRSSTDEDSEAQDPMQLAVSKALESQIVELNRIKETVKSYVELLTTHTIEKLAEFDEQLASHISPNYKKEPAWEKAFSFSLTGDDDIPINKRGSGVRRLVLFSFFRASIENSLDGGFNNIIYAVEEPETSQHPNFQKIIVDTFANMVINQNCQVMLTTHVPGLAGLLPVKSLRYVTSNEQGRNVLEATEDNHVLQSIAETLGVYPDITTAAEQHNIKLIICVEGPNDVNFINILSSVLHQEDDNIIDISDNSSIIVIPLGGGNLQHWVNFNYLTKLGIREYHIYDRDDDAHYQQHCDTVNHRDDGSSSRITRKRETENYLQSNAIYEIFEIDMDVKDTTNVPKISVILKHRSEDNCSESKVKILLNTEVVRKMSLGRLRESDPYSEILGWLTEIKQIVVA